MLEFIKAHIPDIIVCAILAVIFAAVIIKLIRDRKKGRISCAGCEGCAYKGQCNKK